MKTNLAEYSDWELIELYNYLYGKIHEDDRLQPLSGAEVQRIDKRLKAILDEIWRRMHIALPEGDSHEI